MYRRKTFSIERYNVLISAAMSALEDYCKEINLHVRHIAQLLVAWYTFFVTANIVAIGWFFTTDPARVRASEFVIFVAVTVFVLVNAAGFVAMRTIRRYFVAADRDLLKLLQYTFSTEEGLPPIDSSPIPLALYCQMLRIITVSLLAITGAWLVIGFERAF
jgi:uncharacterized membrane protein